MKNTDQFKLLLIGPRINLERSNVGGATISFESMIKHFEDKNISHTVLDTQKFLGLKMLLFPFNFLAKISGCKIVFVNTSVNGIKHLAPLCYLLARLFSVKIAIRPFGDSLLKGYNSASFITRFLMIRSVFKADILYAQTKDQLLKFNEIARNVKQLKTSRPHIQKADFKKERAYEKRLLFLGHVNASKGINELLAVKKSLGDSYVVDIYGPILESDFRFLENESFYKGVVSDAEQLSGILVQYDLLILPTFYEGEGYPGSIIEAYSYGLPVISTNWKSIPEIVKDGETGFLVEPKSARSLEDGIKRVTADNYKKISENAYRNFMNNFSQELVLNQVLEELETVTEVKTKGNV